MEYKAIIFDLDGTAIPNNKEALPSKELINIINELKHKVLFIAATGRSLNNCRAVLEKLQLNAPSIISGGSQIIDSQTHDILWNKQLNEEQVKQIVEILKSYEYNVFFSNNPEPKLAKDINNFSTEDYIVAVSIPKKEALDIAKKLNEIENIVAHAVMSWKENCYDVHITHAEASKKHAAEELLTMLDLKPEEVVGAGDSHNDLPIFQAVGYRVAMGNAVEELKNEAHTIAPHIDEDGLAKIIKQLFS